MPLADADRMLLEQYIDGDLTGEALALFERRMQAEPALHNELALQQAISLSLRRSFMPTKLSRSQLLEAVAPHVNGTTDETPPPLELPAITDPIAESPIHAPAIAGRVGKPWLRRFAIAAMLLGGIYGAWIAWPLLNPPIDSSSSPSIAPKVLTASAAYNSEVASGFEPDWVCANDEEFINTFKDRLGQGLVMKPATDRAHMLGLDYAKVLSPLTITMLGKVDDQPVLVIIDRTASDKPDSVNADLGGLNAFRREIGSLVLYEITPLDAPAILDLIGEPGK